MIEIRTTDDIYPAITEIRDELCKAGLVQEAEMITFLMVEVPWTTRGELFEALVKKLSDINAKYSDELPMDLSAQIPIVNDMMSKNI